KLVLGVVALILLAAIGLLVATRFIPHGGGASNSPVTTPTTSGGAGASTPAGQPTPVALTPNQVRIIDPQGNRTELSKVGNVVDGDPTTVWKTDNYKGNANFGGLKDGMGILVDLGQAKAVKAVKVNFTSPGATVELRAGTADYPSTKE